MTLQQLAREAFGGFERKEVHRHGAAEPETITTLRDEARDTWIQALAHAAHGDMFPDDWRYDVIHSALATIVEMDEDEDPDDLAHEFADSEVDTYNAARFAWLASNLTRQGYVDVAREDGLIEPDADIAQQIGGGQYAEAFEVFGLVLDALRERLEALEDEEEDNDDA